LKPEGGCNSQSAGSGGGTFTSTHSSTSNSILAVSMRHGSIFMDCMNNTYGGGGQNAGPHRMNNARHLAIANCLGKYIEHCGVIMKTFEPRIMHYIL